MPMKRIFTLSNSEITLHTNQCPKIMSKMIHGRPVTVCPIHGTLDFYCYKTRIVS